MLREKGQDEGEWWELHGAPALACGGTTQRKAGQAASLARGSSVRGRHDELVTSSVAEASSTSPLVTVPLPSVS